ncbi:hypothetical protein BB558_003154, partial [Smittium angustum]
GQRVLGYILWCTYAEYVCVKEDQAHMIPNSLKFEQAACFYITYSASYAGLVFRANLKPGTNFLVYAAAGCVGIVASTVIAAVRSGEKFAIYKKEGVDHAINYRNKSWTKRYPS